MSRSYKKTPVYKDHNKGSKNWANRRVRNKKDFDISGSAYKRLYCQYDISDFHFYETLGDMLHWCENNANKSHGRRLSDEQIEEVKRSWYKYHYRK